jgi:hypothetical protein
MRSRNEIEAVLQAYHHFADCSVEDITWRDFGTTLVVTLDYIWSSAGQLREDLDTKRLVDLNFYLVQELHVRNALNAAMCREPSRLNWGVSEVAIVRLMDRSELVAVYRDFPVPFYHIAFLSEGDRRIDIVFSELSCRAGT